MFKDLSFTTFVTGFVVAIVGFFSSFPILLEGINKMGANEAQAASALMIAAICMGVTAIMLSVWFRSPISVAWTTPGLAFLAVANPVEAGIQGAVAAFIIAALATVVAGLWRPLGRLAEAIPAALAQAMLAGILFALCLRPIQVMHEAPWVVAPILAIWFVVSRFSKLYAVPAAVLLVVAMIIYAPGQPLTIGSKLVPELIWITPEFSMDAVISLAIPLFIITMATQNIPGIAIQRAYGFQPPAGPLFATVGFTSLLTAPFANAGSCLAAITAAMCCNPDSHPQATKRYWSAIWAGLFYCSFGLLAGIIIVFATAAPTHTLTALTAVALFGVFTASVQGAWQNEQTREPAAITFLITASGISAFGLGAAVCGLAAGLGLLGVKTLLARLKTKA